MPIGFVLNQTQAQAKALHVASICLALAIEEVERFEQKSHKAINFLNKINNKAILLLIKMNGLNLRFLSKPLRSDLRFIEQALSQNPDAIKYAELSIFDIKHLQFIFQRLSDGSLTIKQFNRDEIKEISSIQARQFGSSPYILFANNNKQLKNAKTQANNLLKQLPVTDSDQQGFTDLKFKFIN